MSPRAAWRLESLGFSRVYDYEAGKSDWTGSGLPTEGRYSKMPRPGYLVTDVPTCSLGDSVGDVKERVDKEESSLCIVTTDQGVVLGRLRSNQLSSDPDARVEQVMEPGPASVRYDEFLPDLVQRMQNGNVGSTLVTTPAGRLVGVMYRSDAEELLEEIHRAHHHDDG